MQQLTFHRYLERYVRSLSNTKTNSVHKLVKEVPENLRLKEPLFLYALCFNKMDLLLKASVNYIMYPEYADLSSKYNQSEFLKLLMNDNTQLNDLYRKVYRSYVSRRDTYDNENYKRRLIHKKTRKLQEAKSVSNYRIYTDLKLNQSNVNAYLKHGDIARVNKETAYKMVEYLEAE
jgi:hypothetical protein